jgi:hypothetical protein
VSIYLYGYLYGFNIHNGESLKDMTAAKKIAQKRLTLPQLAERLRNVSEACRHHGVSVLQVQEGIPEKMGLWTGRLFRRPFHMKFRYIPYPIKDLLPQVA